MKKSYEKPEIEVILVSAEQGFAASSQLPSYDEGGDIN